MLETIKSRLPRAGAVIAIVGILGLAGCSSSSKDASAKPETSTSTPTTRASLPISAVFTGSATVDGAIQGGGPISDEYRSENAKLQTCREIAAASGLGAHFVVPFPKTLGEHNVTALATAAPYKGPGTYRADAFARVELRASPKGKNDIQRFAADPSSTVLLEVKADGSGTFTFTDLANSSGKKVSGSATWKCA